MIALDEIGYAQKRLLTARDVANMLHFRIRGYADDFM